MGPRRLTQGPRIYTPNFTNACRFYRRIAYDQGYAGRPLALLPDNVAALTCAQWKTYPTCFSELHLKKRMSILDTETPSCET